MNILILGGAGYIGSYLYFYLTEKGHLVTSVDLEWFAPSAHANIEADYDILSCEAIEKFDVVILLAAYASTLLCQNKTQYQVIEQHCGNFSRLFEKIKVTQTKFIYASTGSVYGKQDGICTENDSLQPASTLYDLTKRFNDEFVLLNQDKVEFYGLRFGTLSGWSPHLRTDIMLNSMYLSAKEKGFITCSAHRQNRAILDIEDLALAVEAIIDCEDDRRGIYNLASFNNSIGSIAREVASILNCYIIDKIGESPYSFMMDCSKIKRAFPSLKLKGTVDSILMQLNKKSYYYTKRI